MTQEDKQLLLKDLSTRLPYGVICEFSNDKVSVTAKLGLGGLEEFIYGTDVKPYLRPMSSMTEEEANEVSGKIIHSNINSRGFVWVEDCSTYIDWLNFHHFDYRGLIDKGLALEAPKGMYE